MKPAFARSRRRLTMREALTEAEYLTDRKPYTTDEHLRVWRWSASDDAGEVSLSVSYDIFDRAHGVIRPRITLSGTVASEIERAHRTVEVLSIAAALGMNLRTFLSTIDVPLEVQ